MAQAAAARVLYTKQLQKKKKTWQDGFVLVRPSGSALLYDEDGKELASCIKLPGRVKNIAEEEELRCWCATVEQQHSPTAAAAAQLLPAAPLMEGICAFCRQINDLSFHILITYIR
jgi:hypothetical protein